MSLKSTLQPLVDYLSQHSRLDAEEAAKLVSEVIDYLAETPENFVRRRHRELRLEAGWTNERIFTEIEAELGQLVFAPPALSRRQIRRIIYG